MTDGEILGSIMLIDTFIFMTGFLVIEIIKEKKRGNKNNIFKIVKGLFFEE